MASVPSDPITALAEAAVQLHELFEALISAGFSQEQALELTRSAMLGNSSG